MKIKLGSQVQCRYSGFKGTVVSITEWLHGSIIVQVMPKVDKEGKLPNAETFNIGSLDLTQEKTMKTKKKTTTKTKKTATKKKAKKK